MQSRSGFSLWKPTYELWIKCKMQHFYYEPWLKSIVPIEHSGPLHFRTPKITGLLFLSSIKSKKLQISNTCRMSSPFWHFLTIYRKLGTSLQTFTFGNGTCCLTFYLEIWDLAFLTRKSFQLCTKNFDSAEKKPRTRVNAAKIWLRRTTTWKAWKIGSSLSFAMMWENFFDIYYLSSATKSEHYRSRPFDKNTLKFQLNNIFKVNT